MRFLFSVERHSLDFGVDAEISSWALEADCFLLFVCIRRVLVSGEVNLFGCRQ